MLLQLKNIQKKYSVGAFSQAALDGLSVDFEKQEFVAIVGPSGCGKTTTLNIIGGLDRYDAGDVLINGRSTKEFSDEEWDAYRNNAIGFVFQNYHLIQHLSVKDNVILGMTLSGVSVSERTKRALDVLDRVGLKDHAEKKPNQLSGGQMQRVAIARALANDPDIILADEPTGALDSETSEQIMKLIAEIAKEKLVILVTHNQDIANRYAKRIVKLVDGKVVSDSKKGLFSDSKPEKAMFKKTAMHFSQALKLSFHNLRMKKIRTLITAFAGSIGIIGIALVLALSNGLSNQVNRIESETSSNFPISISRNPMFIDFARNTGNPVFEGFPDSNEIYPYDPQSNYRMHTNVLTVDYLDYVLGLDEQWVNDISIRRGINLNVLMQNQNQQTIIVDKNRISFSELPANRAFFEHNYGLLAGEYPVDQNDLVLVVDERNRIDSKLVTALGMDDDVTLYHFDDFIGQTMKLIMNDDYYTYDEDENRFSVRSSLSEAYDSENNILLSIVGVVRIKEDAEAQLVGSGIKYMPSLTHTFLANAVHSEIAISQAASDVNVLNNQPLTDADKAARLRFLGYDHSPTQINIYPKNFEAKEEIKSYLDAYNEGLSTDEMILYDDLAEALTEILGTFLNTITIVLVAFSAISLVVSSIMIGIITYISVLERTKEIGVLRSLGARKKDIRRVFLAETALIGFSAGTMGIVLAVLLTWPINAVARHFVSEISGDVASLTLIAGIILLLLSITLTTLAGLVPSQIAARKNPVEALRSE